ATAAFGEMFVQTNGEYTDILPCIPDFMKNGKICGLRARGGLTINIEWQNRSLKAAEFTPDFDGEYRFRYNGHEIKVTAKSGEKTKLAF
ncbi:MAG: hypothetical protein IJO52_04075, partial [Clostridia bacterium]|nr:hypothetical protein [Clostridia bacterium]